MFVCSLLMGLSAYLICSMGDWSGAGHTSEKIMILGMGMAVGIGVYLFGSYWMRNEELLFLLKMLRKRGQAS
jgi:hypothetical protein